MTRSRREQLLRGLVRTGEALLGLLAFVAAALVGVVVHIDGAASRQLVAETASAALSELVLGSVEIQGIDHIHPDEIFVQSVVVRDEHGSKVTEVSRVRVIADLPEILERLAFGEGTVSIVIDAVRAERSDTELLPDPVTGQLTIARALTPRPKPAPTKPSAAPSRHVRVWMPLIEIGTAWGRGRVGELPTMEATLRGVRGSLLGSSKGVAIDVERFGAVVRGLGGADALGTGDLHVRAPGRVWTNFDGFFGDLEVGTFFQVHGTRIDARIDLPRAKPDAVRALFRDWPLTETASVSAELGGDLPTLAAKASAKLGDATLTALGKLTLAGDVGAVLELEGRSLDARTLWKDAPETRAQIDANVDFWVRKGKLTADLNGTLAPLAVAGYRLPTVDFLGSIAEGSFSGRVNVHEPGMPIRALLTVHSDGAIDIDADARSFFIQQAPRLRRIARGLAAVRVLARVEKQKVDARITARVDRFEMGKVRLGRGTIEARARGPLTDLRKLDVDASVRGSKLAAGAFSFDRVTGAARGSVMQPRVRAHLADQGGGAVTASGKVDARGGIRVSDLALAIERGGAKLEGKVDRFVLDRGELDVKKLALTGAGGELSGSLHYRPKSLAVDVRGTGVDLGKVTRALGLARGTLEGTLSIDANARASPDAVDGEVRVVLSEGSVYSFPGVSLQVTGRFDGSSFDGSASGGVENIGRVIAAWRTELPGSPLDVDTWKRVVGTATVKLNELEAAYLGAVMPARARVESVEGKLFGDFRFNRSDPAVLPSVQVVAETKGLLVARSSDDDGPPVLIEGLDLQAVGSVEGATGRTEGTTRLVHAGNVLATATGKAELDLERLIRKPAGFLQQLLDTTVDASLTLEKRSFAELPELVRPAGLLGTIEAARLELTGTPRRPTLRGSVTLDGVTTPGSRAALPVRVTARPSYSPDTGRLSGTVEISQQRRVVGKVTVNATLPWAELTSESGLVTWAADVRAKLLGMPLGVVPALADSGIGGRLVGQVRIARASSRAQVIANVTVEGAEVAGVPVGVGKLAITDAGDETVADVTLRRREGALGATIRAGVLWDHVLPEIDESRLVDVSLTARALDAVVLKPVFGDVVSELGGELYSRIFAKLHAEPDPKEPGKKRWAGDIDGDLTLRKGVVQVATVGLELRQASFVADISTSGGVTTLITDNILASARSRVSNLRGRARLDFRGLRLTRGSFGVGMRDVPLLLEGVSMGKATGTAAVTMRRDSDPDRWFVKLSVPQGTLRLPRSESRNVVRLRDNADVEILQDADKVRPERAVPWKVVLDLTSVHLRRGANDIAIRGKPVIDIAEDTSVSGEVELIPGGRMETVSAKVFTIETGRVFFDTGVSTNPRLDVTARWRAPDGTFVYADVAGTLERATMTFRSVPPRTDAEILALLLGGGSSGAGDEAGNPDALVSTGFGTLLSLSEVLADTPFEVRADSTAEGRQAITGAFRTGDVTAEVTYAPPGTANVVEEQDDFIVTTDLRFTDKWSLRYQVGPRTLRQQIDLLWQYRY